MIKAAQYALYNHMCRSNAMLVINEFAKELKNITGKCMDIGCGPGDITKNILLPALNSKATMIGTDIMEDAIKYANKIYSNKEQLKFEVLDIQTKKLPEKYISKFDHIFSFHALQWCYDVRQTFENIYHMLRPDKTMLILFIAHSVYVFESLEIMSQDARYASYMGDKKMYVGSFHYSARPREELIELLEDIGFQVHHCSHRQMDNYKATDTFLSMVTSQYTFKFLDEMSPNLRKEFMNEFASRCTEIEENGKTQGNSKLHDGMEETDIPPLYTTLGGGKCPFYPLIADVYAPIYIRSPTFFYSIFILIAAEASLFRYLNVYHKIMIKAAQYALYNHMCRSNAMLVTNEFANELKNITGKCMDVGCGPGDITKDILLPALNPKATMIGIDIMKDMVEYANKTYGVKDRLKFEMLDIVTKELPEKYISKFEHIFSFHALQWFDDVRQTFQNIHHMLRPGKTMLILSIARHAVLFESLEIMAQDTRYASYMGDKKKYVGPFHYSARPREELIKILEDVGFQIHHCSLRQIDNFYDTDKFQSMVISQESFKFLDEMPPNLREEFENELARRFKEKKVKIYRENQGNSTLYDAKEEADIPVLYSVLIVYAQKNVL